MQARDSLASARRLPWSINKSASSITRAYLKRWLAGRGKITPVQLHRLRVRPLAPNSHIVALFARKTSIPSLKTSINCEAV